MVLAIALGLILGSSDAARSNSETTTKVDVRPKAVKSGVLRARSRIVLSTSLVRSHLDYVVGDMGTASEAWLRYPARFVPGVGLWLIDDHADLSGLAELYRVRILRIGLLGDVGCQVSLLPDSRVGTLSSLWPIAFWDGGDGVDVVAARPKDEGGMLVWSLSNNCLAKSAPQYVPSECRVLRALRSRRGTVYTKEWLSTGETWHARQRDAEPVSLSRASVESEAVVVDGHVLEWGSGSGSGAGDALRIFGDEGQVRSVAIRDPFGLVAAGGGWDFVESDGPVFGMIQWEEGARGGAYTWKRRIVIMRLDANAATAEVLGEVNLSSESQSGESLRTFEVYRTQQARFDKHGVLYEVGWRGAVPWSNASLVVVRYDIEGLSAGVAMDGKSK